MSKLLNVDELSNILNIKKSCLYHLAAKRKIPSVKIGKHVRFYKRDIEGWLERKYRQAINA